MTRGLTESARLGVALGAKKETFAGLSGVGDLIVTCCSMHSRNHRCGIYIGEGMTAKDAMDKVGAVVEGYYATASAHQLAEKYGIEMPIADAAYQVLYGNGNVQEAIGGLMRRQKRHEPPPHALLRHFASPPFPGPLRDPFLRFPSARGDMLAKPPRRGNACRSRKSAAPPRNLP